MPVTGDLTHHVTLVMLAVLFLQTVRAATSAVRRAKFWRTFGLVGAHICGERVRGMSPRVSKEVTKSCSAG